jgi:hypothetical protein
VTGIAARLLPEYFTGLLFPSKTAVTKPVRLSHLRQLFYGQASKMVIVLSLMVKVSSLLTALSVKACISTGEGRSPKFFPMAAGLFIPDASFH